MVEKVLPQIAERAKRYGLDTAMLEHLTGGAAELHDDLTKANVSSWQQWAIATNSLQAANRGGYYYHLDSSSRNKPALNMAVKTRELMQYFRFVRAGAVRIGATSSDASRKAVAFRNVNDTHVVVVQGRGPATISIAGLPGGTYGVRYTTAAETGRDLPARRVEAGQALIAQLPAKGVITFHQHAVY
jgi:O-glycosyl hydrolase